MRKLRPTSRKAVLAGMGAAAATAAVVAMATPASAAPSQLTSCSDTVRVRSNPDQAAPVVGSCQAGERVTVDETRNGYAHLVNKRGWASMDYVRVRDAEGSSYDSDSDSNNSGSKDDCDYKDDSNSNSCDEKDNRHYRYSSNGDRYYQDSDGKKHYDKKDYDNNDDNDYDNNDYDYDYNNNKKGLLGGL